MRDILEATALKRATIMLGRPAQSYDRSKHPDIDWERTLDTPKWLGGKNITGHQCYGNGKTWREALAELKANMERV